MAADSYNLERFEGAIFGRKQICTKVEVFLSFRVQAQCRCSRSLMGDISHAEGVTPRERSFIPRPYRICAVMGISQSPRLCPLEGLHQLRIRRLKLQAGGWS